MSVPDDSDSDDRDDADDRQDPQDRRREPRHRTNIEVDYASNDTFLFAYITDISSLGIFVQTDEPLDPGAIVTLRFTPPVELSGVPPQEPLEFTAEIVWNTTSNNPGPAGMGARFIKLSPGDHERLLELVRAIAYLDGASNN